MKKIEYLYYFIYSWNLKTWGTRDAPQWNALIAICFLLVLNFQTFFVLFTSGKINETKLESSGYILFSLFLILGYFKFINKNKFNLIFEKYKSENNSNRNKNGLFIWLYVIVSFGSVYLVRFILGIE